MRSKHSPLSRGLLYGLLALLLLGWVYYQSNFAGWTGLATWGFFVAWAYLLTYGLPTTLVVHALAAVWVGLPFGLFLGTAALLSLAAQVQSLKLLRALRQRKTQEDLA
ncbi:MAG TPA: hypothetical protein ENK02_05630 [Planctomycetes bacterium]|nr:hypothetical protein [Planctomycetota bacterium]